VSGKAESITAFGRAPILRKEIDNPLQSAADHLVEKIAYNTRYLLTQLPSNLECAKTVLLSGGGSLIEGIHKSLGQQLNCKLLTPSDPIFSNVLGFYKMGRKLYG
jgi:actin-like ATPase involved in cell morphogenesis